MLIVAVGIWAYHNSFHGPFIFDDVRSIPGNPHIRHLWPISEAMSAPLYRAITGRPVVCLTLALNYALGGLNVWGYHVFNLAVHVLSAPVLFGLLRRTLEGEKLRERFGGTAAAWLAAAIALIWEVHPLQTESVTYIVQRSELLMGLFLLLTLYCFIRGVERSGSAGASPSHEEERGSAGTADATPASDRLGQPTLHRQGIGWFCLSVVSCLLGMGSKEVMVGAPLIVLVYDRVFLAASFRELWQRRMSLYIGLAATWVLLAVLVGRTIHPATRFDIQGLTAWNYLMTEAGVIVHYLRLCFWPHPLVIDYEDWPIASSLEDVLVPGVALLGLLGATVWALRYRPWAGFLGAWFFLILGPTSSILPSAGEVAAERRMYLPLAAVVTLTVLGAFALGKRLLSKRQGIVLGSVLGAAVVAVFGFLTIQRNQDYRSALAIWQDTITKRPNNARAEIGLGNVLFQEGSVGEAIGHYEQALRIRPHYAEAHYDLGTALLQAGREQEAISRYEQALRLKPDYAEAHDNLGVALLRLGRMQEAIEHWNQALRIKPGYTAAHNNLGNALRELGRPEEAIGHFEQVLQILPGSAEVHYNLGVALEQAGRAREAIGQYELALRIEPDLAEVHYNLGLALKKLGRTTEAIQHYEQALRIKPDFAKAQNALARARAAR